MNDAFVTCGHRQPDDAKVSLLAMKNSFESAKSFEVTLHPDFTVETH